MKVAVIGGGWAGIAAAVELTAAGVDTTLFEAGRTLGGRARSVSIDGRTLDNGQHILLGAYRETLALMRRIGADPEQLLERHPLQVVDNAGFRLALPKWPAPLNVAWGLLAATGVGWREKLATAWWMQGIKARHFRLPHDLSVAEWLDTAGQNGALRRHLWEPLCLAALNIPAERASAQVFANVLRDSLGSAAAGRYRPAVTARRSWRPAARTGSPLAGRQGRDAAPRAPVAVLATLPHCAAVDGKLFDAVIVATAPQHAGKLWPALAADFGYEPIVTVYLQFEARTSLAFPLQKQSGKYGQWVVDRGKGLTRLRTQRPRRLGSACRSRVGRRTRRGTRAANAARLAQGHLRKARHLRLPARTSHAPITGHPTPRILRAGDYTWADYPGTLEGAVRSGRRAAHELLGKSYNRRS